MANNSILLIAGGFLLGIIILAMVIILFWKVKRLQKFQQKFFRGTGAVDLEQIILNHESKLSDIQGELKKIFGGLDSLQKNQLQAVQHIGVVRFNAYADAGGNNSFAVALINEEGSGIVISSLYGRDAQRVYIKPIIHGQSEIALTGEEKQAILESQNLQPVRESLEVSHSRF